MTVITYDGKTIAADSLTTVHDQRSLKPAQKLLVKEGHVFGAAGNTGLLEDLADWYLSGAPRRDAPCGEWALLVVDSGGRVVIADSHGKKPVEEVVPIAIGSGYETAMGALLAGASAERAVEITCKLHISCGPPVVVIDVEKALASDAEKSGQSITANQALSSSELGM